jgi:putative effector of murein hydrolase
MDINTGFIFSLVIIAIFSLRVVFSSTRKNALLELLDDKHTLVNFATMFIFIGYMLYSFHLDPKNEDNNRIKDALKKAIVAFVIAIFSKIDLIFAPFWFVWLIAYYLDNWV